MSACVRKRAPKASIFCSNFYSNFSGAQKVTAFGTSFPPLMFFVGDTGDKPQKRSEPLVSIEKICPRSYRGQTVFCRGHRGQIPGRCGVAVSPLGSKKPARGGLAVGVGRGVLSVCTRRGRLGVCWALRSIMNSGSGLALLIFCHEALAKIRISDGHVEE